MREKRELIKINPTYIINDSCKNRYFYEYMEMTLEYFSNNTEAKLDHWPDLEIGLNYKIPKTNAFYNEAQKWFEKHHKVKILVDKHSNARRFLASFVVVAGYPPHLGFRRIVGQILKQSNWDNLYENLESELNSYIDQNYNNLNQIEKQLVKEKSEGYESLFSLLQVLVEYKHFKLSGDSDELAIDKCINKYQSQNYDIIKKIISSYSHVLSKCSNTIRNSKNLYFNYKLVFNGLEKELILISNINSTSYVNIFSKITSLSNLMLTHYMKELEILNIGIEIDNYLIKSKRNKIVKFSVLELNENLKKIEFFLKGVDEKGYVNQIPIYEINRNKDYLVFDEETGIEIDSSENEYLLGKNLDIIPLNLLIFEELQELEKIGKAQSKILKNGMPTFCIIGKDSITIGDNLIQFIPIPVSFSFERQNKQELLFGNRKYFKRDIIITFYNSSNMDLEVSLYANNNCFIKKISIQNNMITLRSLEPNKYYLEIESNGKKRRREFFILPIENIQLLDREIEFQLMKNWVLQLSTQDLLNLKFKEKNCYSIQSFSLGVKKANLSLFSDNNIILNIDLIVEYKDYISVNISGKSIKNNQIINAEDITLDSNITFSKSINNSEFFLISVSSEGGTLYYTETKTFFIDCEIYRRFSLFEIMLGIRKNFINKTTIIISDGKNERFKFFIERQTLPLFCDNYNRVYSEPNGVFDGYIVFDLLRLNKPPLIIESVDYQIKMKSFYKIYGFKKYENCKTYRLINCSDNMRNIKEYSIPIISESVNELKNISYDKFKSFLIDFYKTLKLNQLFNNTQRDIFIEILKNKDTGLKLIESFQKMDSYSNQFDFDLYLVLPMVFPVFAVWLEFARDPSNVESHYINDPKVSNALFDTFFLYNHPVFSWILVTQKDIFSLLDNEMLNVEDFNLFLIFCASVKTDDTMNTLSWLLMFFVKEYCKTTGKNLNCDKFDSIIKTIDYNPYTKWNKLNQSLLIAGCKNEIRWKKFYSEQVCSGKFFFEVTRSQLNTFVKMTEDDKLWKSYRYFLKNDSAYKKTFNQIFKTSSLYKERSNLSLWCIFISHYLVFKQLDTNNPLEKIIKLDNESLAILCKWLKLNSFNMFKNWYDYWMVINWEKK